MTATRLLPGLLSAVLLTSLVVALGGAAVWAHSAVDGLPPPPADLATEPLLLPPQVPDAGGYAFLAAGPTGNPVAWDPCRPVHVVVRATGEPAGGRILVEDALREVGTAAGLVFVVDGDTDEAPTTSDREAVQPDRYGNRWAPVLVAWSSADEHPPLAEQTIGVAGPVTADTRGGVRFVSGQVVLDAEWFGERTSGVAGRQARAVLLHELGHLVGLDHSADPFALMSAQYQSVLDYGTADRAGLARLGGGPCFTDA